jgi:hypothetical protein
MSGTSLAVNLGEVDGVLSVTSDAPNVGDE